MSSWTHEINDWTKISEKTAGLMLSASEKALSESIETFKNHSAKTDKLLSICLPILTVLVGVLINKIVGDQKLNDFIFFASVYATIIVLISSFFITKNLFPSELCVAGAEPKMILKTELIDNDLEKDEQYINMIITLCENYQNSISRNRITNNKRNKNNVLAIKILLFLPISPLLSWGTILSSVYLHQNL